MSTRHRILVVEDEEHLAAGIRYNLDAEGYDVTVVGDGPSALQHIEEHEDGVDLLILDLMLPGMSGYAVCETLRSSGHDLPILILSARTLAEDRKRGFDLGADQYLTKPFDLDEFLSRVRSLLRLYSRRAKRAGTPLIAPASVRFGEAEVDFESMAAVVAGRAVRLTQLEWKLLRYFVENEGRVITRRSLLADVWGLRGNPRTRAPDQFLRRLRKIFEPVPSRPRHFLTVRDAGYRFVQEPESSDPE